MELYIELSANSEYCDFDCYHGIVTSVEDRIRELFHDYPIVKHETEKGIYVGLVSDDDIADFNNYVASKKYLEAYYYCTYQNIFFKKETI